MYYAKHLPILLLLILSFQVFSQNNSNADKFSHRIGILYDQRLSADRGLIELDESIKKQINFYQDARDGSNTNAVLSFPVFWSLTNKDPDIRDYLNLDAHKSQRIDEHALVMDNEDSLVHKARKHIGIHSLVFVVDDDELPCFVSNYLGTTSVVNLYCSQPFYLARALGVNAGMVTFRGNQRKYSEDGDQIPTICARHRMIMDVDAPYKNISRDFSGIEFCRKYGPSNVQQLSDEASLIHSKTDKFLSNSESQKTEQTGFDWVMHTVGSETLYAYPNEKVTIPFQVFHIPETEISTQGNTIEVIARIHNEQMSFKIPREEKVHTWTFALPKVFTEREFIEVHLQSAVGAVVLKGSPKHTIWRKHREPNLFGEVNYHE